MVSGTSAPGAAPLRLFIFTRHRVLALLAGPGQRASLIAAIWIIFFLSFSVPVVIAGVATSHFGLHSTAVVYSAALAALAAGAAGSFLLHRRPRREQRPV